MKKKVLYEPGLPLVLKRIGCCKEISDMYRIMTLEQGWRLTRSYQHMRMFVRRMIQYLQDNNHYDVMRHPTFKAIHLAAHHLTYRSARMLRFKGQYTDHHKALMALEIVDFASVQRLYNRVVRKMMKEQYAANH